MLIDLTDTNSAKINNALLEGRRKAGSPAMGMVLTLVIATDEKDHYDAARAATEAAREHPSRILVAVRRGGSMPARLDAEVRVGGENGPGEVVLLRMYGELADHPDSVVLPLLLPDAPVVTWWAGRCPTVPVKDPLGALAQRRVTDAGSVSDPLEELGLRAEAYAPGDTDLSWTRVTTWRTLLAATLDEPYAPISRVTVAAEQDSPSAELLSLWLGDRLGVPVAREITGGPGITSVLVDTGDGPISITRPDGRLATLTKPGQPHRSVALPRRSTADLIAEELRRLDPDDTYGRTVQLLRGSAAAPDPTPEVAVAGAFDGESAESDPGAGSTPMSAAAAGSSGASDGANHDDAHGGGPRADRDGDPAASAP